MAEALQASRRLLQKILDRRPVLWVGAGLSVAAGLPSTRKLVEVMAEQADQPIDKELPFEKVADAFLGQMGEGALSQLLQEQLSDPVEPTPAHLAIARAALAGRFAAILTTNYDDLLEQVLSSARVRMQVQVLEKNATFSDEKAVHLLKLHGSRDGWEKTVLSGRSYETYQTSNPLLKSQLDVYLRRHRVLFVGCSLQDPRILEWLGALNYQARSQLQPWRALICEKAWEEAVKHGGDILAINTLKPLLLDDHDHLQQLWEEAVPKREDVPAKPCLQQDERTWADLKLYLAEAGSSKCLKIGPDSTPQSWWDRYKLAMAAKRPH